MNLDSVISARVLALIAAGQSPVDALRAVCGAKAVDKMIADLYDKLMAATTNQCVCESIAAVIKQAQK